MEQQNLQFDVDYKVFEFTLDCEFLPIMDDKFLEKIDFKKILVFYFIKQKRLYLWLGPEISRELRNQVLRIEGLMKNFRPNYRVMRKFIIEGANEKPADIYKLLQINPTELAS
jgi:hypothetical protein